MMIITTSISLGKSTFSHTEPGSLRRQSSLRHCFSYGECWSITEATCNGTYYIIGFPAAQDASSRSSSYGQTTQAFILETPKFMHCCVSRVKYIYFCIYSFMIYSIMYYILFCAGYTNSNHRIISK
jgi:hypothetical protein